MNSSGIQIQIYPKLGSSTNHITFLMVNKMTNLIVRIDDALINVLSEHMVFMIMIIIPRMIMFLPRKSLVTSWQVLLSFS